MKYTLVVRQASVVDAGLLGKVSIPALCLLDYLHGWFIFDGAKIEFVSGRKFVWLHSERAIEDLPMLFSPQAKLTSRKNQLSTMIDRLREAGLVETRKIGRRLFFSFTDLANRVTQHQSRPSATATKPVRIITPPHDDTVTPGQDRTVTSIRDDYPSAIIDETGTRETERKETPPLSPTEGEAESILAVWNSFPRLLPAQTITPNRARKIRKRLAVAFWREHWREGIQRAAASQFLTGNGQLGWRATFDWFLGGDSLAKILEGAYDNQPRPDRKPFVSDLKARLRAVDALMAEHPANRDSTSFASDATAEQRADFSKLRGQRSALLRQIADVPPAPRPRDGAD